jgi:hypothetical protein
LRNILSETDLAILCAAELRRAGFLVTETNQAKAQPPLLIIEVIPFRRGEIILYSIEVRLEELARLLRKETLKDAPDLVSSWGSSTTDAVPLSQSRVRILDNARRGVELFIQDWKAANPR